MFKGIRRVKLNSIRLKVSLFYTAILGVILIAYTAILYFGQQYSLYRDMDRQLTIKAQEITGAINALLPVLENDQRAFRVAAKAVIGQEGEPDYVVLAGTDGEPIAYSKNINPQLLIRFLRGAAESAQNTLSYRDLDYQALRLRLVTIPYYYKSKRIYILRVGSSREPIMRVLYGRILFASFTIPFVLLFASFLGGIITERILAPAVEVANAARNITLKDLSARVKIEQVDEELRPLVDAFNEMISRLENSFRYVDEFSSNVVHELKTPLTIISGESELALMKERDIQEYKRVIDVNLQEAGHMLKIVDDLLLLSRLEHRPEAFNFVHIDFSVFMTEIFEQAQKLALSKKISVELHVPEKQATVLADWLHLRRLFFNLINNAVKFTPAEGSIAITVTPQARKVVTAISDTGAGIAPGDIDKIFDRFYRIEQGPSEDPASTGLGLSIAQSIAKIHHGDITVTSLPGRGSTFTVTLPTPH